MNQVLILQEQQGRRTLPSFARTQGGFKLNNRVAFLAALVAIVFALANAGVRAASNCQLIRLDEWPVRLERNLVLVDGEINGKKIGVMLDTGAMLSLMPRSSATRLGLERRTTPRVAYGVGGMSYLEVVGIDEFKINQSKRRNWRVYTTGEKDFGADIGFILGEDFFSQFDVEFDLAHNVVRLFQAKDCNDASLSYWAPKQASELAIDRVDDFHPQIILTVLINGQPLKAQLDSGAALSILTMSAAALFGITPETPGVSAAGKSIGMGPNAVDSWIGPVKSVVIGNESISDTTIHFGDIYDSSAPHRYPMLLGADFLLAHRVLVAHSQRKIYFTHNGGPVFQRTLVSGALNDSRAEAGRPNAAGDAANRSNRQLAEARNSSGITWYYKKDYDRAIAEYDAAIQTDPQYALAFNNRGGAWKAKGDIDRAIADYDAAIRLDPQYANAFANRGIAKVDKGDVDQGIADLTRAIEIKPNFASAFVDRGNAKGRNGDFDGSIADYSRAIEVDPKLALAYNKLAWELATVERPTIRDGRRAVESAVKACELTEWKNVSYIDTLAAAYARAGEFADAVKWQHKAMEDPRLANDEKAAQRLRLYEEGKAWPPD